MRTASKASQAFAEAIKWLTGQIPQIRAISEGISENGRPSQNFSNPRNCVTCKCASLTSPSDPSWIVILPWPSIRVTGLITIVLFAISFTNQAPNRVLVLRFGVEPSSSSDNATEITSADGGQPGTNTSTG